MAAWEWDKTRIFRKNVITKFVLPFGETLPKNNFLNMDILLDGKSRYKRQRNVINDCDKTSKISCPFGGSN